MDRLFLGPVLVHLEQLDEEIEQQKISIIRDRRFLSYEDKIVKESKVFEKYITKEIPDDDVVNADFLSLIERLATKSNVSLVKSNPSHITKKDKFIEYVANIDCTGKLEDVIAFMHQINTTDDLLKIIKFNMSPRRGTEDEVKASMAVVKLIVH